MPVRDRRIRCRSPFPLVSGVTFSVLMVMISSLRTLHDAGVGTGNVRVLVRGTKVVHAISPFLPVTISSHPKTVQISFDVAKIEKTVGAGPVVNQLGNLVEARGVAPALLRTEAAADEEVAVDQLVKEGGDEKPAAVLLVAEDRRREDDQGLVASPSPSRP